MSKVIQKRDDYNSGHNCTWCPGCGNYAIWYMLKQAFFELGINPHEVVVVYGIGCAGNGSNFTEVYTFHGLHGRAVPVAQGIKLANQGLKVIVMGGDGDGMGIGVGHFIHACRRNIDLTYIMHDNQIYGLTTGQTSPRSDKGMITKTSVEGNWEDPVNPISLALSSRCSFVARAFSGSPHHLKKMLIEAIQHKGFSFVDVLQPCITFNKQNTYGWYGERVYDLQELQEYDEKNYMHALDKSVQWGEKIPMGIFFKENRDTYEELMNVKRNVVHGQESVVDVEGLLKDYEV